MIRKVPLATGEYYHLYNRGVLKREIFLDDKDWARFLLLAIYFQFPIPIYNLGRPVSHFVKHRMFNIKISEIEKIIQKRTVELAAFALMPNHFHFLVKETITGGISKYMQRLGNSYAKYFNTKYKESGHLFQGSFKSVHITDNNQLLYTTAYIHLNPRTIKKWQNKEENYPWSSFQDYVKKNRWNRLLANEIITEQFEKSGEYLDWVKKSGAKDVEKLGMDINEALNC